jgi:hypothetical protein
MLSTPLTTPENTAMSICIRLLDSASDRTGALARYFNRLALDLVVAG